MKKCFFIAVFYFSPLGLFCQFNLITVLPDNTKNCKTLNYSGLTIIFDNDHCIPLCSVELLTKEHIFHPVTDRKYETFYNDENVPCSRIEYYRHSGQDRGHLTPAADMKYSKESEHDCFKSSNICPQSHDFNTGIWEDLEKQVRQWAIKYDSLVVITAPVIGSCTQNGNLVVPGKFYKIIYSVKYHKAIAFLMDASLTNDVIFNYEFPVSDIIKTTGLDYFSHYKVKNLDTIDKHFWN